ncbi:hypothetical protein BFJ72_g13251 [Fusarium proliferatum]|uniref:RING-type domain-containing protein n=1 Tax=Gibberella intermedia TaxID=948311 RepID=A0A420SDJ4_GIBIN|nr:hypothetical protein FPRO03_04195 [Fusarium proliferatum]RKL27340.1 hypothetical protein BFJ72_g13251 [Fusarium proliferatum]
MASTITEAQAELIRSLAPDDIPIKLRCAICSKLAVNAYRLPCCEQAICESCQSNLPASCPVCEHSPLSAEDCNPNKSLRTTIRVFLRTAEKKREASRPKEDKDSEPVTPVEAPEQNLATAETSAIETPIEQISGGDAPSLVQVHSADKVNEGGAPAPRGVQVLEFSGSRQGPSTNIFLPKENITHHDDTPAAESPRQVEAGDAQGAPAEGSTEDAPIEHSDEQTLTQNGEGGINGTGEEHEQQQMEAENDEDQDQDHDHDQEKPDSDSMNGNFPSGSFSNSGGDFNQMQMMMAMQNGMTPNSFGGFTMMGMPGMGMDPMTMQNMYMNGGFQGMAMNGMGGFGGGFGQGSNNNWNGSQSWNFDQNNYNQNGPGMGTGDFGGFNSGFQTGYNQGNYGQFNDYRRNTFGRGRGRGRGYYGGYGRGGYQFGGNPNYHDQTQGQSQVPQVGPGQNGQNGVGQGDGQQQVDESGQPIQGDSTERPADAGQADGFSEAIGNVDAATGDASSTTRNTGPGNSDPSQGNISGAVRPVAAADVPLNAPTGPKAMRQGLPNTSLHHLRARGYQVGSEVPPSKPIGVRDSPADRGRSRSRSRSSSPAPVPADAREEDKDRESRHGQSKERPRDQDKRDRDRDHDQTGSASRTVSRSRSRSRGHRSSRRRRRHRSESVEDEGYDDDSRRKKHRSRRHFHDDEESSRSKDKDKDKDEKYTDRNRSASPAESKRSSHRSRRDRDSDKRRDREKDKDDDRKRSSHRPSHRDRDYDRDRRREKDRDRSDKDRKDKDRKDRHRDRDRRDRDRDREREKDRDRDSGRDRDRERDRDRDRSSRYSSRRESIDAGDSKPISNPRGHDTKVKTSSSIRTEQLGKDPHTLEREARDRERLLKEAQRIAGMAGWKRSRGDDGDDAGSRKGRRTGSSTSAAASRRSEAINGGDEEERMRRLEAEREGDRWG